MLTMNGASGFYRTPVTKALLCLTVTFSIALTYPMQNLRHLFRYNQQMIVVEKQLWRLAVSKLVFLSLPDMLFSCLLMFYFRVFERRYGSRKYCSYLLATSSMAVLLEGALLFLLHHFNIRLEHDLPSGPICMIFPQFVQYYLTIPRVALTTVVGVPVTGKTFTYIIGLQVASATTETRLVAACAVIAGLLWRLNLLKVQSIVFVPAFLARWVEWLVGNLLDSSEPSFVQQPMGATLELQRQEQMDRLEQQMVMQAMQNSLRPQPQNLAFGPGIFGAYNRDMRQRHMQGTGDGVEVSEDQVQRLIEMGFTDQQVRQALTATSNDLSMATNMLLQET